MVKKNLCVVCELVEFLTDSNGRANSRTCGPSCSQILNSVKTDSAAREKWLQINLWQAAYKRFCLGFQIEEID